jgi:hypothetical protein
MRPHRIELALSDRELTRLDELRPTGVPRATYLRRVLYEPPTLDEIATYDEVLGLLSRKTREGSVGAAVALERALRGGPRSDEDWDDELGRLLGDD